MSWANNYLKFNIGTIRIRLLLAFILTVSLPAIIISLSSAFLGYQDGQSQVINKLELVAPPTTRPLIPATSDRPR